MNNRGAELTDEEQSQILHDFYYKIYNGQKPIPAGINTIIDNNFWELNDNEKNKTSNDIV